MREVSLTLAVGHGKGGRARERGGTGPDRPQLLTVGPSPWRYLLGVILGVLLGRTEVTNFFSSYHRSRVANGPQFTSGVLLGLCSVTAWLWSP